MPARCRRTVGRHRLPMRMRSYSLFALVTLTALAACGGGDKPTAPQTPQLASMTIAQKLDTLSELNERTLTLAGVDSKGQPMSPTGVSWVSSDTTIATVSATGTVTGVQPGNATITAKSGSVSAALAMHIVSIPVRDVSMRLVGGVASDTLLVGTTVSVIAEARDIAGRVLLGRQITVSAADGDKISLASGKVTGVAVGYGDLIARTDSIERRRTFVVRPPFAAKIAIKFLDPRKLGDTTWAGLKDSALVTYSDSAGQVLAPTPLRPVSYQSDNPSVAIVDPYGKIT